jgi:alpha-N-arabinofuranosidase
MANIAQMINVFQSMILADKEKVIVTPTHYVYELFAPHHNATFLPADLTGEDYAMNGQEIPGLSVSPSADASPKTMMARGLTASTITAHNTFDNPSAAKPEPLTTVQLVEGGFSATLPAKSAIAIELK